MVCFGWILVNYLPVLISHLRFLWLSFFGDCNEDACVFKLSMLSCPCYGPNVLQSDSQINLSPAFLFFPCFRTAFYLLCVGLGFFFFFFLSALESICMSVHFWSLLKKSSTCLLGSFTPEAVFPFSGWSVFNHLAKKNCLHANDMTGTSLSSAGPTGGVTTQTQTLSFM